ncbi:MAG: YidC/Oxa1 family membrane protein insertase [Treponemataceae bacterium]|nr:MAG: YidC/Oxa1 family membrane protein insertase [Treponemataceae bacterium]
MSLTELLFNIIIFPLIRIIELFFMVSYRLFGTGTALVALSAVVTALTLPLYMRSEKWQKTERETQKKLEKKLQKIQAVFSGDERYMIRVAFYRQAHYHPVFALRNTFGLLIQIPFFIAAYTYLSHLELLKNASFFFIADLSAPDALLSFAGHKINVLPIVMTALNVISGIIYTKGFRLGEKIQLYAMAAVFLVLLYASPSALVIYWTLNNIFSLAKNILLRLHEKYHINLRIIVFVVLCAIALYIDIYTLFFFHKRALIKHISIVLLASSVFFLPLIARMIKHLSIFFQEDKNNRTIFLFAVLNLTFLFGLVIPASLISSSVTEFSYIENHTSPLYFLLCTFNQAAGFFLFWGICIYALFDKKIKLTLAALFSVAVFFSIVNVYIFPGNYGTLTTLLTFSNPVFKLPPLRLITECIVLALVCAVSFFLLQKKRIILTVHIIIFMCLTCLSGITVFSIINSFDSFSKSYNENVAAISSNEKTYHFSRNGKNVLILMLDRAISGLVPSIFAEKPELIDSFDGFVWYKNCLSFGPKTLSATPALFGGYEYTPKALTVDTGIALVEKHNQALLLMPLVFSKAGFEATFTDPSWANYSYKPDLSIFKKYPEIKTANIISRYTDAWIKAHSDANVIRQGFFLRDNLLRFSFFRATPEFLRNIIYDNGKWVAEIQTNSIPLITLDEYSALEVLPRITSVTNSPNNTFTIIVNQLTHEPTFLSTPEYVPSGKNIDDNSIVDFRDGTYHVNMAAFLLLKQFFDFLKAEGVYDNTRIIIVADHGASYKNPVVKELKLHADSADSEQNPEPDIDFAPYNPLLLYKDFNQTGKLAVDETFMTNADTFFLASEGLVDNPQNPFTKKILNASFAAENKADGILLTTNDMWTPEYHAKNYFKIRKDNWFLVKDNIFKAENWTRPVN